MNFGAPVSPACPLCGSAAGRRVGVRGNREYPGADRTRPHLVTNVLRCSVCDFYYIESLAEEAAVVEAEHYSDSETYPGMADGGGRAMRTRLRLLRRHSAPGLLLDVGAGKGEFVRAACASGWSAVGIEPSASLARHAALHGANVHVGYLEQDQSIPAASYSFVTLFHVLEHVEAPIKFLTALGAYLRPEGHILVEVPNCGSLFLALVDSYYAIRGQHWSSRLSPFHPPFHRWGYTKKSLRYALEKSGFAITEMGYFSGRDRGYGLSRSTSRTRTAARAFVSMTVEMLGNRELLYAVARSC